MKARLAACANLVPGLTSYFWWQGRLDTAKEALLLIKTTRQVYPRLQVLLKQSHPYESPEIIALPIVAGERRYLAWIAQSVRSQRRAGRP